MSELVIGDYTFYPDSGEAKHNTEKPGPRYLMTAREVILLHEVMRLKSVLFEDTMNQIAEIIGGER